MTDNNLPLYECDGVRRTVKEWAEVSGILSYTIHMRLRQGWSMARIIAETKPTSPPASQSTARRDKGARTMPPRVVYTRSALYEFNGEALTLSEWAARIGIGRATLMNRIKNGWPIEKALTPQKQPRQRFEYEGRSLTIEEWSGIVGICVPTLRARLYAGWTIDLTLSTPARAKEVQRRKPIAARQGGGSKTFESPRGPAGDHQRVSASK